MSVYTDNMAVENHELRESVKSEGAINPLFGLRAANALHRMAERFESHYVRVARERGWSWEQIGDALGISRQSVHIKYSKGGV